MVSMFTNITNESILEQGALYFKRSNKLADLLQEYNEEFAFGISEEIPEFLGNNDLKVNVWIHDENGNYLRKENIKAYEQFMNEYDSFDCMIREEMVNFFNDNKEIIVSNMRDIYGAGYCNTVNTYNFTEETIDKVCELSGIMLDNGNLSIVVSGYWNDTVEIPIIYNEVATFRDLDFDTDMAMIRTKGKVRSFLGENGKEFDVWLMNSYEIDPIQENRYRDFQKRHSYYSNLVADSLIKYYKINIRNIKTSILGKDRSNFIDQYDINKKDIYKLCTLDKLEINKDGTTTVVIDTNWDEKVSIKLWNKDIPLTNYFALPMCGSKFGPIN